MKYRIIEVFTIVTICMGLSLSVQFLGCHDDDDSTPPDPTATPVVTPTPTPEQNLPPDTLITSYPDSPTMLPVSLSFIGQDYEDSVEVLTYSFRLNSADWSPWQSETTVTFEDLADDEYYFEVKARDSKGVEDATPAGQQFVVDMEEPETWLVAKPPKFGNSTDVYFEYSASDNTTHPEDLEYSFGLDDWGWSEFSLVNNIYFYDLEEGPHDFYVRSRDVAGNIDSTPDYWRFNIDCGG